MLGKRKRQSVDMSRRTREGDSDASDSPELDAQEIFRRHFEAQFKPLPEVKKPIKYVEELPEDESEEESEWGGITDEEDGVQVVEHTDAQARTAAMSKEELKKFMVIQVYTTKYIANISADL